jgi:hypothetical protein
MKGYRLFILHDDCPQLMIFYISIKMKENRLIEVWIAEK